MTFLSFNELSFLFRPLFDEDVGGIFTNKVYLINKIRGEKSG
jgi:hypothetical protein